MVKRDRTPLFLQLRASTQAAAPPTFLHARPLAGAPSAARGGGDGGTSGSNGTELVSLKRASTGDPPDPEWVSRYYALVAALEGVRADHAALTDAQARHLLPAFGEDDTAAAEEAIASSTRALTAALHAAERELRALAPDGRGAAEARVVENIKRALAGTLQAASLAFRADQKEYMVKLQGMKDAVGGSVLDRVDYNVEAVRADTGRAVGQLRRAERAQRARASFWCLLCLAIGCGIMASALLLKWLF
eukprot:contig_12610_g3018